MGPSLGIRFDQTDTILKSKKLARVWRHSAHCASLPEKKIFVYSKDDCPLCDGLKQKLSAILDRAPFTGSLLKDYSIEVRDILTNRSWEEKYSMHIPVMAIEHSDGQEVVIPRTSPRVTSDRLERHIVEFLESQVTH